MCILFHGWNTATALLDKPLKTSNMETKDKELIKQLAKQIAFGSAMAAAFLVMVYLGGLAAHLISGTY